MLKMSDKRTPRQEKKLKQWYATQKESLKVLLVFSRIVIQKYSGHMFVVSLKLKPAWHPSYRIKRMKLQQNLTGNRWIFFENNLLVFLKKNRMLKCSFLIEKTEVNPPNIIITEETVRNKILKLNVNKSCGPDEIYPQILIELIDLVSKPLALLLS